MIDSAIWTPCARLGKASTNALLEVVSARGAYLTLQDGKQVIDATASWWCKSVSHRHPRIREALIKQLEQLEHVIPAGTIHLAVQRLSEQLSDLMSGNAKVFYASDGSSAVEIALKLCIETHRIQGRKQKTQFVALRNGYHGETLGALSVSPLEFFSSSYEALSKPPFILTPPYVSDINAPLDAYEKTKVDQTLNALKSHVNEIAAVIIEPIVQGAGGMKFYSPYFVSALHQFAKAHGIYLIADEIMTGMGRTGKMLAVEHANIMPDIICLSKGLTGGVLPLSAVITASHFYQVYAESNTHFTHSHTYSGNALAASVALAVLEIIKEEDLITRANHIGAYMLEEMQSISEHTKQLKNVRQIGAIVAADFVSADRERPYRFYQQAIAGGALVRPLGETIYWLPPLDIPMDTIADLAEITCRAIVSSQC